MDDIQEAILALRKRRWPVKAIAAELGVHEGTVWSWLAGRGAPSSAKAILTVLQELRKKKPPTSPDGWRLGPRGGTKRGK